MLRKLSKLAFLAILGVTSISATPTAQQTQSDPNKVILTKDNTVVMDQEFTAESVARVALEARKLDSQLPSASPIYLVILSGGGSIVAGMELIDNLNTLNRPVHTVTLFGASMAFQTAQGLGTRYVSEGGTLMSHKAKGQIAGEMPGQVDSRYLYFMKFINKLDEKTVARSGGKLTLQSYRAAYANELWCAGQECVDIGVADKAVKVQCDKSLDGTKEAKESFSFLGIPIEVEVVKAACPTITAPLETKVKVGDKKVDLNDFESLKWTSPTLYKAGFESLQKLQTVIDQKVEFLDGSKRTIKTY